MFEKIKGFFNGLCFHRWRVYCIKPVNARDDIPGFKICCKCEKVIQFVMTMDDIHYRDWTDNLEELEEYLRVV